MKHKEDAVAQFVNGLSRLTPDGSEILDPRPVELPVGFEKPESIQQMIKRLVLDPAIRAELQGADVESFDEADDFEVDDDLPLASPYEENFDPLHVAARESEIRAGAVVDRTLEEKQAAQALLEKRRAEIAAQKAAKQPAVKP